MASIKRQAIRAPGIPIDIISAKRDVKSSGGNRHRQAAGQRIRAGDRHKAVRSDASCRCDCRRSWGCVHLRENRKRSGVVACGLWFDTNAFFAAPATLASPVGGTLLSTYIGARVAIVGSVVGCG